MMRAEREEQNDWDRNADQPKEDGTHNYRLVLAHSGSNNVPAAVAVPVEAQSASAAVPGSAPCSRRPRIAARNMIVAA